MNLAHKYIPWSIIQWYIIINKFRYMNIINATCITRYLLNKNKNTFFKVLFWGIEAKIKIYKTLNKFLKIALISILLFFNNSIDINKKYFRMISFFNYSNWRKKKSN